MLVEIGFWKLKEGYLWQKALLGCLLIFYVFNWLHFVVTYSVRAAPQIGFWRNYSAKDMALHLNEVHQNYERVIITNDPDDPYPWFAFYNKFNPREFNNFAIARSGGEWEYKNLLFTQRECPSGDEFPGKFDEPSERNVLVVDGFRCPVESKIKDGMQARVVKQFYDPDGKVAYTLWGRE
jgi:hypothetical protein